MTATRAVKVQRKRTEASDIVSLELVDPKGAPLPAFSAGSHIDVETAGQVRQYSLCNPPTERQRYLIGILLDPDSRGGSAALHAVTEGETLQISEPRNHFALEPTATRTLLFGGGIGVTPLLCMAEELAARGADFMMHYCARSKSRAAFHDRIAAAPFADRVAFHFDDGEPDQKLHITEALGAPDPGVHVYVCGPAPFIDFVLGAAEAAGFSSAQLHREYFSAEIELDGGPFQIKIASTGQLLDVPADVTAIEAMRRAGLSVPTSCEQGVCGTCLTKVLEGVPDHRDLYLTPEEQQANTLYLPCCSRSKSPVLVLDI